MRSMTLTSRNTKEILRDPLTTALGLAIPLLLLILFTSLNHNKAMTIPVFKVENLTPGIVVFGFSFLMMFSGMLLAKDRKSAFLTRLFASPMKATDYICGYIIPFIPIAILQALICYAVACILGLTISINVILSFAALIPAAIFAISLGMIIGSLLNEGQVSGFGSVFITVTQLFSGAWMDLKMAGGIFEKLGYILPFSHAIDAVRGILAGNYTNVATNLYWVLGYMVIAFILAIFAFRHAMKR